MVWILLYMSISRKKKPTLKRKVPFVFSNNCAEV